MPSVSKRQHNAMEAAAHGRSKLGISAKVGKDYVTADKVKRSSQRRPLVTRSHSPVKSTVID